MTPYRSGPGDAVFTPDEVEEMRKYQHKLAQQIGLVVFALRLARAVLRDYRLAEYDAPTMACEAIDRALGEVA